VGDTRKYAEKENSAHLDVGDQEQALGTHVAPVLEGVHGGMVVLLIHISTVVARGNGSMHCESQRGSTPAIVVEGNGHAGRHCLHLHLVLVLPFCMRDCRVHPLAGLQRTNISSLITNINTPQLH